MKNLDIQTLLKTLERQSQEIALLKARIHELEKHLNKGSSNSSKPPSSDGFRKSPKPVSLRAQGKRSSGGQKGHRGESLKQVPHPNFVIVHKLHRCPECQKNLTEEPAQGAIKRQVFDIQPPAYILVTKI